MLLDLLVLLVLLGVLIWIEMSLELFFIMLINDWTINFIFVTGIKNNEFVYFIIHNYIFFKYK